ncbi:hypothetical protein GCM10017783_17710 [Deinococcus piscis]|uniref:DUF2259 domain-containing protein n=1 Tax=Deinococcus piscis TaxID=394230 RepID=A0ABQ3KB26_9DEIO|nr:DUF2259 domain-containing protein [Deinococcus piscis]GHG05621.1 hypothetical protein GCM10017783_17710 [Deinococcus piscis]
MKRAISLLLTLLTAQATAANLPQPYRYGFSQDGAYHLMLTTWTEDGSGFPAASLRVVRQGVGVVLEDRQVVREEAATEQATRDVADGLLNRHAARLKTLGLEQPVPGQVLWAQAVPLPSLAGWPPQEPQTVTLGRGLPSRVQSLEVRPQAAYNTCQSPGILPAAPVGLRLKVNGADWFRDSTRLPENRACVAGYRLEAVWQHGDAVAVLLRAYGPGFEGPDALPLTLLNRLPAQAAPVQPASARPNSLQGTSSAQP